MEYWSDGLMGYLGSWGSGEHRQLACAFRQPAEKSCRRQAAADPESIRGLRSPDRSAGNQSFSKSGLFSRVRFSACPFRHISISP